MTWSRFATRRGAALLAMVLGACASTGADDPPSAAYPALVASVCPMLWDWQRDVGGRINEMSGAAIDEDRPEARQTLYLDTFADIDVALDRLADAITEFPDSAHTATMQSEITTGIDAARRELDDLTATVVGTAVADEPDGRRRVPTFFGEFEKVIDLVKPEIAGYEDPELTTAFAADGTCRFAVKDVDDGVARSNG